MSLHYLGKHEPRKLGIFSQTGLCKCLLTTSDVENVSFLPSKSHRYKNVIANGHGKLNRLMIAQTQQLFPAENY